MRLAVYHRRMALTRRHVIAGAAAAGMTALVPSAAATTPQPKGKRVLRFGHLTDIHVQPEKRAEEGMVHTLEHVQNLSDKPDLIVTGGDLIMDAFRADRARTKTQWDIFQRVIKNHVSLPVEHCIGNHDVWHWPGEGREPERGKKWPCDALGLAKPYRAFDRAGWRFIVLDSTFPRGEDYVARLDDEQYEWLVAEIAASKGKPVIVVSHIPILAACAYLDGDNEKDGDWKVPGAWMHIDARKIVKMFHKAGNVKLAISGHIHLVDRVDYLGTTYFCNGAVCGGWWNGNYQECEPGYALVNLYENGEYECEYVTTGWKSS